MKLPNWLYEPLPYLYMAVGAFVAWQLDEVIGELSGLLLISAGLVVANMRHEYRKLLKHQPPGRQTRQP